MHQDTAPKGTLAAAIVWIIGLFVVVGGNGARFAAAQTRPNILLIMSDDHFNSTTGATP